MRVTLVNLLVVMAADLPAHIGRHIGIRQLRNESMAKAVKAERLELTPFAALFDTAIAQKLLIEANK